MTSNCWELYNNWIHEARFLPVVHMLDHIRIQIMERMNTRRQMVEKWATVLCPELQKILKKNISEFFSLHVIMEADDVHEIFDWCTVVVRPIPRSYTYQEWNVTSIPCKHACTVIPFMQHNVVNYLDDHMKVETFKRTYVPTLSYYWFGQAKSIILQYSVHLSMFHPLFWHYVHIFGYMSTFWNICPHFGHIIYVQI